jgi:hypothetical protein
MTAATPPARERVFETAERPAIRNLPELHSLI